jgi:hypothetical protein
LVFEFFLLEQEESPPNPEVGNAKARARMELLLGQFDSYVGSWEVDRVAC